MILVQPLFLCPESQGSCACRERSREGVLHRSPRLRLPLPRLREEELPYVVARGDQPPLERHLLEAPQRESREPEISLDVPEHGLHVDGAPLPQSGPGLGVQHLAGAAPERVQGRVHLDLPGLVRVRRLRALGSARAALLALL